MLFPISCILTTLPSMPRTMLPVVDYTTEQLSLHLTWLHQSNHFSRLQKHFGLINIRDFILFHSILIFLAIQLARYPSWRTELGPQQWKCQVLITGPPGNSQEIFKVNFHTQNGLWLCIFTLSLLHVSRTPCLSHYLHITILKCNINKSFLRSIIPIAFL